MMTIGEVARIFNVHPSTIRRWCEDGKLKAYRSGPRGRREFSKEDVAVAYLEWSIRKYIQINRTRRK
jgi:excisionase family DNA binding protein